ncbi:hypothetical protein [Actinoplanes auranticolor]|uniref:Lipoprotein n=1 Tax=Actinoplanes auranticolor TaxID=47988 RepID=A0A919SDU8_9ACTN|nr:hypothetical protein [Actinoplanes auranticolor]GIM70011.1 hypothetical protein Aau02nite_39000 [Actinoplanes auranticolor]
MFTRSVPVVALGALLVAGLAACSSTASPDAAKAPAAAPSAAPAVSATTPPADPTPTDKAGGSTKKSQDKGASANCPVTAGTLRAAIKKEHPSWGEQELTGITCYQDYAISTRRAAGSGADTEVETFRYTGGAWQTFTGGSGGYCDGVPEDVTEYFRDHGRAGCES